MAREVPASTDRGDAHRDDFRVKGLHVILWRQRQGMFGRVLVTESSGGPRRDLVGRGLGLLVRSEDLDGNDSVSDVRRALEALLEALPHE